MTQPPINQLTPLQQTTLDVVRKYPGQFSRSGLAKMLVGAKSWSGKRVPEYGRFAGLGRKSLTFDIDTLLQQSYLRLDSHNHLIPFSSSSGVGEPDSP